MPIDKTNQDSLIIIYLIVLRQFILFCIIILELWKIIAINNFNVRTDFLFRRDKINFNDAITNDARIIIWFEDFADHFERTIIKMKINE